MTLKDELLAEVERLRKVISDITIAMCFTTIPDGYPSGEVIRLDKTDALITRAHAHQTAEAERRASMDAMRRGTTYDTED